MPIGKRYINQIKMAHKKELIENWNDDMARAIGEQDVLELRSQLEIIHNLIDQAIRKPKRMNGYRKAL
jgi:hypothetical protein